MLICICCEHSDGTPDECQCGIAFDTVGEILALDECYILLKRWIIAGFDFDPSERVKHTARCMHARLQTKHLPQRLLTKAWKTGEFSSKSDFDGL